ncbi:MAG: hypothetical protein ACI4KR_04485, partial [Ruminiclostridium sp.]
IDEIINNRCSVYGLVESNASDEKRTILKYTSAPALYNTLLFIFSRYVGADSDSAVAGTGNIYTFISANGCGATSLAMAFAENLSEKGKKVLFLGLDGFSDYASMLSVPSGRGLSDVIMSLKSKNVNISLTAKSVTNKGKFSFIDKCRCPDDIYELDSSEINYMFNKITDSDSYDAVVLDISFFYTELWAYAAENSKLIFAVAANNFSAISKTNNLIDTIKIRDFRNGTNAYDKLSVIVNKCSSGKAVAELDCPRVGYLPKYSANDYSSMLSKISADALWSRY